MDWLIAITHYIRDMCLLAAEGDRQGIFFWISIYVFFALVYSFVHQLRTASWPSARGVLLDSEIRKFGATEWVKSDQDYVASALYEYIVDGVKYQGKRVSPWLIVASHNMRFILKKQMKNISKNEDGTVKVFFNPKKPKKSFLIKPGNTGKVVTLALAVTPLVLYISEYHM